MNKYLKSVVTMLTVMLIIASCGSDDPAQSDQDRVKGQLTSGTWKIQSVDIDDVDKTSSFTGLQIVFANGSYTTTNGNIVWPATGTWTFTAADAKAFNRNDGVEVNIEEITDTKLVLSFDWDDTILGPGRVSALAGKHTFTFSK